MTNVTESRKLQKKWMFGLGLTGIVFLLFSIAATGGGHGSLKPAVILTPFIAIAMVAHLQDNALLFVYILPSIGLYIFYGWLIGRCRQRKYVAFPVVMVIHIVLVVIGIVVLINSFPNIR